MKYLASLALALAVARATPVKRSNPQGIDVSDYQGDIDWAAVADNGIQFAYIKATEGTSYISPTFSSQYTGAANVGIIRGAYHSACPDESDGATQASFFIDNGGSWYADGITLPGALDLRYNPNGAECYGLSSSAIVTWIGDFSNTYYFATGRYPVIYTTTEWWNTCTNYSEDFGTTNPLWFVDWASQLGPLPAGWSYQSFWQYADSGPNPGNADLWNGDYGSLQGFTLNQV